jgi:hypothetical protein
MTKLKNLLILSGLLLALAAIVPAPASAQATATNLILTATQLAAAVTDTSRTTITLASSTGVTAGSTVLWIDDGSGGNGEAVFVNSVGSGGQVVVQRGYGQSFPSPHLSGAVVLIGAAGSGAFVSRDPSGACTASAAFTPTINTAGGADGLKGGNQWLCSSITNSWVPGYFNTQRPAGVTTAVASVAGATNPSGPLFHVSGTNAITAWGSSTSAGLGAGGGSATQPYGAPFCVIPDAAFTWTATNNIAVAGTAVANLVICFTFDGTNKKYVQIQSK